MHGCGWSRLARRAGPRPAHRRAQRKRLLIFLKRFGCSPGGRKTSCSSDRIASLFPSVTKLLPGARTRNAREAFGDAERRHSCSRRWGERPTCRGQHQKSEKAVPREAFLKQRVYTRKKGARHAANYIYASVTAES